MEEQSVADRGKRDSFMRKHSFLNRAGRVIDTILLSLFLLCAVTFPFTSSSVSAATAQQMTVIFKSPKEKAVTLKYLKRRASGTGQDVAAYRGKLFELGTGVCSTGGRSFPIKNGHGNNCNFGIKKHGAYPYLYCAPWNENDNHIYVNELTDSSSKLVDTITYPEIQGYMNAVVDEEKERAYIFLADQPREGHISFVIGDLQGNVLRIRPLSDQIKVIQGMTLYDNKIYVLAGLSEEEGFSNALCVFNLNGDLLSQSVCILPDVEMEGITVDPSNGTLYIANSSAVYTGEYHDLAGGGPSQKVSIKDDSSVSIEAENVVYTGVQMEPPVTVKISALELKEGQDYSVDYQNNINAGTAKATIQGEGIFTGSITCSFKIKKASIEEASVTLKDEEYTGKKISPSPVVTLNGVTLNKGEDYTIKYSNNVNVGEARAKLTGKGNYQGTLKCTFKILPVPVKNVKVTPSDIQFSISYNDLLIEGIDYILANDRSSLYLIGIGKFTGIRKIRLKKEKRSITLKKGETFQLNPCFNPVRLKKIKYKSKNPKVAKVSKTGLITAKRKGKAKIVITSGKQKIVLKIKVKKR